MSCATISNYGGSSSAGVVLVLFILLVIVVMTFCVPYFGISPIYPLGGNTVL
ncbi:hypothetical protein [Paenibacillus herberti]|uniref:hypothetical protein n=1 Tax=Paenibacillus herberti TaxID=1619309 RepID=UPI0015951ED6|nr:hypothetical protein [Paenibacillus herberti]